MVLRAILVCLVAAALAGCDEAPVPSSPSQGPPAPPGPIVAIVPGAATLATAAFAPNPVTLRAASTLGTFGAGSTVVWVNNDTVAHAVASDDGTWPSEVLAPGVQFGLALTSPGTYRYHCAIHPTMVGTLIVQ